MTFRDWFTYQKLKLKSLFGLLPPQPTGKHVHQCPKCGQFWMHYAEDKQNEIRAHTCPQPGCGGVQFWPVGRPQDGCAHLTPSISEHVVEDAIDLLLRPRPRPVRRAKRK